MKVTIGFKSGLRIVFEVARPEDLVRDFKAILSTPTTPGSAYYYSEDLVLLNLSDVEYVGPDHYLLRD